MRAPLAPPRLSEPRKVEAEAHAVLTSCAVVRPEASTFDLRSAISASLSVVVEAGMGSCQRRVSFGTSGPR